MVVVVKEEEGEGGVRCVVVDGVGDGGHVHGAFVVVEPVLLPRHPGHVVLQA